MVFVEARGKRAHNARSLRSRRLEDDKYIGRELEGAHRGQPNGHCGYSLHYNKDIYVVNCWGPIRERRTLQCLDLDFDGR
jgi:hypothetical protein